MNIIDTCWTLGDRQGQLGPQSIVGVAAFNFLVISAIAIIGAGTSSHKVLNEADDAVINTGSGKLHSYTWFYWYTAVVSLLAYGWTFYCLFNDSISKHEAGLTVGFYFIVLIAAYIIDRLVYFCCRRSNQIN